VRPVNTALQCRPVAQAHAARNVLGVIPRLKLSVYGGAGATASSADAEVQLKNIGAATKALST